MSNKIHHITQSLGSATCELYNSDTARESGALHQEHTISLPKHHTLVHRAPSTRVLLSEQTSPQLQTQTLEFAPQRAEPETPDVTAPAMKPQHKQTAEFGSSSIIAHFQSSSMPFSHPVGFQNHRYNNIQENPFPEQLKSPEQSEPDYQLHSSFRYSTQDLFAAISALALLLVFFSLLLLNFYQAQ